MGNKWFVVDCHSHYLPPEAVSLLKGTRMEDIALSGPMKHCLDVEGTLSVMEEAGIDMSVIGMSSMSSLGLDFCMAVNNGYARIAKEYPGKFVPLAHVPLATSPDVMKELDRSIKGLGLQGVVLETSSDKYTLGAPEMMPLFEKINSLGIPIVIHPAVLRMQPTSGSLPAAGMSGIESINGAAAVMAEDGKVATEILSRVIPRFPELKVIIPQHGGAMPLWLGRMMFTFLPEGFILPEEYKPLLLRTPRIRQELGLDEMFMDMFNKLYFDIAGFMGWLPITQATLLTVKPQRMVFGTDNGLEMFESQDIKGFVDDIKAMDIPEADRRAILGDTARELFGIQ